MYLFLRLLTFFKKILNNLKLLVLNMAETHFIKDERLRERVQVVGAVLGAIGVVIAILSFII